MSFDEKPRETGSGQQRTVVLELHSWKVVLDPLVFSLDLVEFLLIWLESKPPCERWKLHYPQFQTHPHPRILFSTGQELDQEEASF